MDLSQPDTSLEFRSKVLQSANLLMNDGFMEVAKYLQQYSSTLMRDIEQKAENENRPLSKDEKQQIQRLQRVVSFIESRPEQIDAFLGSGFDSSNRIVFKSDGDNLERLLAPFDFRCYKPPHEHMLETLKKDVNIGGMYILFENNGQGGSGLFGQVVPVIDKNRRYGLFIDAVQRGEKKKTPGEWANGGDMRAFSTSIATSIYLAKLSGFDYVVFGEFPTQRFAESLGIKKERVFPTDTGSQRKLGYPSTTPEACIPEGFVYTNSLYRSYQTRFPVLKLDQLKL